MRLDATSHIVNNSAADAGGAVFFEADAAASLMAEVDPAEAAAASTQQPHSLERSRSAKSRKVGEVKRRRPRAAAHATHSDGAPA